MSLFATNFCLVLLQFGRIIYKSVLIECHTLQNQFLSGAYIKTVGPDSENSCETLVLEILLGLWDELEA